MKEKAYELRQKRATLLDESRTIVERCEKENRAQTEDEKRRLDEIFTEARGFAERISAIERQAASERLGPEPESRKSDPLPHEDPGNTGTKHSYSLMRAASCLLRKVPVDGLEGEVSKELEKRTQKVSQGFMMPMRTRGPLTDAQKRALDATAGAGSVPTVLGRDWIELLRARMVLAQAGVTEFFDLQGKFAIPRQNAAATAYWVAESGAPSGSNQTLDQVLFTPKTIGAFTDISRRFFELSQIDTGEQFVFDDLTSVIARGVDLAGLNGSGSSNQPLGVLQNTGITSGRTVSLGTNGGAPTFGAMVALHTIVSRGNAADLGVGSYIGNADVEGTLATTPKVGTTFPVFLLEDGKVYAKPFYSTQMVPNNLTKGSGTGLSAILYGIWSQLCMAYWSGVDILVDPYTGSSSGTVRIVALQDMDIQARHNEAFAVITDMVSNQV